MTPEIGKVYWIRLIVDGKKCGPQQVEVTRLTPKIVEYRTNYWTNVCYAAMRDEVEFVEESKWD